jgi:uncharacterized alpha-E superfamily protein
MLSRIANNLYWAGRNLERMEHIARFVPVNYFASLDAPAEIDSQYMLQNINSMAGSITSEQPLLESDILRNVAFDSENPSSLISCANLVRENCRGARDFISTELWESVNVLYHFIQNFDQDKYMKSSMSEFMLKVLRHVDICKSRIASSLMRNQGWSIINIGLLLERSFQITRIIQLKLSDELTLKTFSPVLVANEFGNLLKSLESFDMNRKFYQKSVNKKRALEFLIFNEKFPRSLSFCLFEFKERINDLSLDEKGKKNSVKLIANNLGNELYYCTMSDIEGNEFEFLDEVQEKIIEMNQILVSKYFAYS